MDDYGKLNTRAWAGIDGFNDADSKMFELFCQFLDATGEDWSLSQIKTKFGYYDLRFYVEGNSRVQDLATALERYWYAKYKPENDDDA